MRSSEPPQPSAEIQPITTRRRERIIKVQEMFEGGGKINEIAEFFNISERMVYKDLRAAKQLNQELFEADQGELLGGEIAFWQQVCRQAMRDYNLSQSENARIGFLRVASEARAKLNKLLQDSGLLNRVPERLMIEEGMDFEDPETRREYLALLKKARARGEKNLGL